MEIIIRLTELGKREKLISIKSIIRSLQIGLFDAKLLYAKEIE